MPDAYVLDRASVESLRREVSSLRHRVQNIDVRTRHAHRGSATLPGATTYLGVAVTEIDAADWSADPPVLGGGEVQPFNRDTNTEASLLCVNGEAPDTETWYNIAPITIDAGRGLIGQKWQGIVLITVELCDDIDVVCDGVDV